MAIVKPGQQEAEAQEMAAAFGEDIPPPAEQTDDEAFGLTPPDQAGGETPGADTATVTADSGGEEVPAEGAPAEIDAFLAALADRMSGTIDRQTQQSSPAAGRLRGFTVRY